MGKEAFVITRDHNLLNGLIRVYMIKILAALQTFLLTMYSSKYSAWFEIQNIVTGNDRYNTICSKKVTDQPITSWPVSLQWLADLYCFAVSQKASACVVSQKYFTYPKYFDFNAHFNIESGSIAVKLSFSWEPTITKDLHTTSGFVNGPIDSKPIRMRWNCKKRILTVRKYEEKKTFHCATNPYNTILLYGGIKIWISFFETQLT